MIRSSLPLSRMRTVRILVTSPSSARRTGRKVGRNTLRTARILAAPRLYPYLEIVSHVRTVLLCFVRTRGVDHVVTTCVESYLVRSGRSTV